MKKITTIVTMIFIGINLVAQNTSDMKTIRLIFPQWQGARMQKEWIPEVKDLKDMSQGYVLGSQFLQLLAPENPQQKTVYVPVDMTYNRTIEDGVTDRDIIAKQTKEAVSILDVESPERIITLGGECAVSTPVFTWLAKKYNNDVAILWIDAHPDITLPGDVYSGYHAMAVTAIMGKGDKKIISELPAHVDANKILFVGLRDWEREQIKVRQKEYGMKNLTNDDLQTNSDKIIDWIKSTGAKHILIHFDLDVLDPSEIIPAVGVVNNGLKIEQVVRIINDVASAYEVNALTIAEPLPRRALQIRSMLNEINLLQK